MVKTVDVDKTVSMVNAVGMVNTVGCYPLGRKKVIG